MKAAFYSGGLPALVVHADWSKDDTKRWMSRALLVEANQYRAYPPQQVGRPEALLPGLKLEAGPGGCALIGFDFPIGLPKAYAEKIGADRFLTLLPRLGTGVWSEFFQVASQPEHISLHRPFYPDNPGSARRQHLTEHLGLEFKDLFRVCELKSTSRRAACPLFWTLGGQQVGKAALSGWREVLIPGLDDPSLNLSLWPFQGSLSSLIARGRTVAVETYPGEFYHHLGISFPRRPGERSGKRSQTSRAINASRLLTWASEAGVSLDPALEEFILDGFGHSPAGEDPFDAVIGLFGMLNLLLGYRELYEPQDLRLKEIEGWIFGQTPDPFDQAD